MSSGDRCLPVVLLWIANNIDLHLDVRLPASEAQCVSAIGMRY